MHSFTFCFKVLQTGGGGTVCVLAARKMAISATGDREMPTAFGRNIFISKYWELHERNGYLRKPWPRTGIYS